MWGEGTFLIATMTWKRALLTFNEREPRMLQVQRCSHNDFSHPNMPTAAQLRKTSTGPLHLLLALSTLKPERAFLKCKSEDSSFLWLVPFSGFLLP